MRSFLLLCLLLGSIGLHSQSFENGFHFYLPPDDSTTQRFLPAFPKQSADAYITTDSDGHFLKDGQPIRFWGMSMAYGACFPDKDEAPKIAARLRKMGVNLVRFTLMDSPWAGEDGTIFFGETTTQVLNFFNLDRLHYFLAQLKEEGIYASLILQDARTYQEGDGVLYADSLYQTAKAVSMLDRHLVQLQKDYALQLLTPVNPYTGMSLAEDPMLAMIDITNENTLYGYWKSDWLEHLEDGGDLLMRHVDTLDTRWNAFLQNKYASQTILETTWNQTAGTGGQNEQVQDGDYELGNINAQYELEIHDVAQASMTADPVNPYEGAYSGRVDVIQTTGTNWHIQYKQAGASLTAFKTYQITFAARADGDRSIQVVASRDNAPYTYYSGQTIDLTTNWQEYEFTFLAPEDNDGAFRLGFQFNSQEGSYWFDELSMTDADIVGILPGESLTAGNIGRMKYSDRFEYSPHRMADQTEFYLALQTNYFDGMYAYLKEELGTNANVTASSTWTGISDVYTARNMDFIDDHNSWDYIRYPNGWSTTDWYIDNLPMVKNTGWTSIQPMFGGLAIKGKPYTIHRYSHPFPNRYQVEMMPWMAAYGSFHDIGSVSFYYYNDERSNWSSDRIENYFSLHRNTAQMALSPVYAHAFRNGLIAPAEKVYELEYSLPFLRALPLSDGQGRWGKYIPYDTRLAFSYGLRTAGFEGTGAPDIAQLPDSEGAVATTDTEETTIDFNEGILKTVTPEFISVCGFLQDQPVDAGALAVVSANDFGVVSWVSLSDSPVNQSDESLLTISSKIQNTNMSWDGTNTIHDDWGGQPTELFPLDIVLDLEVDADYLQLYPLSPKGEATNYTIIPAISTGRFRIHLDQATDQTVWYGVEKMLGTRAVETMPEAEVQLFPNPSTDAVFVKWPEAVEVEQMELVSREGKLLESWRISLGQMSQRIAVGDLPAGLYFVRLQTKSGWQTVKLMVA